MKSLVLIRPEPGLSASAQLARAMGLDTVEWPLFKIEPVAWAIPDPCRYDAIVFTSANAVRQAGSGLSQLLSLPAYAVGEATADAARDAGFRIGGIGNQGVDALLLTIPAELHILHLSGRDHAEPVIGRVAERLTVYQSVAVDTSVPPGLPAAVIAVHSPRAGARLAELIQERGAMTIVAISEAAAVAVGTGWQRIAIADQPTDAHLLSLAAQLCQTERP